MLLEMKRVTGVSKRFHLEEISFGLEPGYILGLAGKNGAGKSTLLHYIMDDRIAYKGKIYLNGKDIRENHAKSLNEIGFVSEENFFFHNYSAIQNAKLLGEFYSEWEEERFIEAMKRMELSINKTVGRMSRGELSKFKMAFAMAHRAKLYLLDEVTGGMDPVFRRDFFQILRELIVTEEASIVLVTHIQEEIELKVDYAGILEQGKLISFREVVC